MADERNAVERPAGPRRLRGVVLCVAAVLVLAGAAVALIWFARTHESGDVAGRPGATVWVKSTVGWDVGRLRMDVDTSEVLVSDGSEEFRPQWAPMASEITTTISPVGDEDSARQSVAGTVVYLATTQRLNLLKLRRDTEFISCTFEFTGEFEQRPGGVRWWRLRRVDPPTVAR